ncbi:XRN 5'-3' exonuclease N-terminus-domain-containing protein [Trichophaea hybrida]|nr:XRN 5'-3' exonuclease N-terminus-domain-containing protein [Trichophaea hybrida]
MGVPKFFRWISERYPTISQLIAENRIPEFDNLYLDMNGIIHNCTHKDGDSATFRMSEDKMFLQIFNYIEHLYGTIKPQKLFFMAIDGVAPRAKMNQQRARRFRTALDAEKAHQAAVRKGVEMPPEDPFDSNCITPGTEFMTRLTEQLKYFVSRKVTDDADWQGIEIILSGPEVPGEGEHKIMEYIRLAKAQPDYDPNVRHCLYGLDADLIMLGLLSHDPHFCLLREEVTFGRAGKSKSKELEHQNFFLMHLSVVREYLEHEFQDLKEPGALSFPFDLERIIDDFILLAFFVGNDFLPNLPNLHINEGALALQFRTYKDILPRGDGYINEHGVINLDRLKLLLDELGQFEQSFFESENEDANWLKGKQEGELIAMEKAKKKGKLVLSTEQKELFKNVKKWLNGQKKKNGTEPAVMNLSAKYAAKDRKFVEELARDLNLKCEKVLNDDGELHQRLSLYPSIDDDESDDEEGQLAVLRVFRQYDRAQVVDISPGEAQAEIQKKYDQRFYEWKDNYYKSRFGFGLDNDVEMKKLTENYVEGLQWVLYYYYRGVVSWPWYYRYHYAPRISDIVKGLGANLDFKIGQPFRPFEQLMGVLPDRSKKIVPEAYHNLMTSPNSPIIDFYPREFELDMNGKKVDWEAVVKIPFIDEDRLLKAMKTVEHHLTAAERNRNDFGVTLKFTYDPNAGYLYKSSMPGIFPDIPRCHCALNTYELPTLDGLDIIVGLCDGAMLGANALAGFPSLSTLEHSAQLGFHGINVFQQDGRNESMVLTLANAFEGGKVEAAKQMIGKKAYVGYPFLQEAKVTAVSDEMFRYMLSDQGQLIPVPHGPAELSNWRRKAERIENHYSKRMGVVTGPVEVLFHVDMLKGMRRTDEGAMIKEYDKIPGVETDYAAQTIVWNVVSEDQRFLEKGPASIEEEFPEGTRAFFLGEFNYGRPIEIIHHNNNHVDVWLLKMSEKEPDFAKQYIALAERSTPYTASYRLARQLGLNPLVLSKITSSFQVLVGDKRLNLGLNLKFEAKKLKVLGYSRKNDGGWEFSNKAVGLIQEYMSKFPQFFEGIMRNPYGDLYHDTDFFDPTESKQKIDEINDWLKSIDSKGFEKVPLEAEQLDRDVVMQIEKAMDVYPLAVGKPIRVNKVPRKALLKPSDAEHRLADQRFALGDRLVYAQDSGKVPIASWGTVIGLTRTSKTTLLDVVWDTTFMSGTTLGNRCSPFRGMTVPISSVLNLTTRQLISITKASNSNNAFRPAPMPVPLTSSYANAAMGTGSSSPSPQPGFYPPPVNGFRGGRGGRGGFPRGSFEQQQSQYPITTIPGRGGFVPRGPTVVLSRRGGPPSGPRGGAGVPGLLHQAVVQPQLYPPQPGQYQNVPPPAILNRGRGGRGVGRGLRGVPSGLRGRGGGLVDVNGGPPTVYTAGADVGPQNIQSQ